MTKTLTPALIREALTQLRRFRLGVVLGTITLTLLYGATCATVLDRFMRENGVIIRPQGLRFDMYLNGEAPRPFAYRVLVPALVRFVAQSVKPHLTTQQLKRITTNSPLSEYMKVSPRTMVNQYTAINYHIAYFGIFISLLGLAFSLTKLGLLVNPDKSQIASIAPIGFLILLPLTFLHGGYLYDSQNYLFFPYHL